MSSHDVRWHRDHGYTENEDAATDWNNYEDNHFSLGALFQNSAPVPGAPSTGQNASGELMDIEVDPQDRIWYISRGDDFPSQGDDICQIGYIEPPHEELAQAPVNEVDEQVDDTGNPTVALELDVMVGAAHVASAGQSSPSRELGGQGIAADPNFEENGYVYVYYHPSSTEFDEVENPYNDDIVTMLQRISRFEFDGNELDPNSETIVYEFPLQINTCCHIGGHLAFGPDGYLHITSGDDSDNQVPDKPEHDHSMTDEREGDAHGRPAAVSDAQRTSGNTADPRGSVLRIDVHEDGTWSAPDGNLKDHWEAETGETYSDEEFLPEIYVMGLRNPFIVTHDEHTGWLFTASYGNDAPAWNSDRGTVGLANYHLWDEPGNAGHPFFKAYYPNRQYDYEADEPRQPFWPDNLRNRSRHNTGIENIPNVTPGLVWHPQSFAEYTKVAAWADMPRPGEITWPQFDEGGSADTGLIYRYRDEFGEYALDPYFDGKLFVQNPQNADNIRYLTFTEDGRIEVNDFLPNNDISGAHDMQLLSDGRLVVMGMYSGIHVIEYQGAPPEKKDSGDDGGVT